MDNERFLRAFGEIDDKYLEKADALYNDWRESQKGISVRADRSRKASLKIAIVSAACTAAAMLGIFALLLNIGRIGIIDSSADSGSTPAQSSLISGLPAEGTTPCNHELYRLGDNVRVDVSYGIHGYTCTVTYSAYRHTKWCASCGEYLGEGPTFRCTEEHTCGNHIKSCTGSFLNDGTQ